MYPQIGGLLLYTEHVVYYDLKIPFSKVPKSISEQIELLRSRGMLIDNDAETEHYLRHLNYYRLGAYWLPFEADHTTHKFKDGATLKQVIDHYHFDRELRILILDAIERIEVSVRSQWAHQMGMNHGAHAHLDCSLAKNEVLWRRNLDDLIKELDRSHEVFVRHFRNKYENPTPPIWAICEVMSLGLLSKWFGNLKQNRTRAMISKPFEIDHEVLGSWLQHLTYVRNICAHHSRLWNRELTVTAKMPRTKPMSLVQQMQHSSRGLYNTLVILDHMLSIISPGNTWNARLTQLIECYGIDPKRMGFPSGQCALLKR